ILLLSGNTFASLSYRKGPMSDDQQDDSADAKMPAVRLHTKLVTMTVKVIDHHGNSVTGLEKDSFEIYDDNVKRRIDYFSTEETPISVGFVVDVSNSMDEQSISHVCEAIKKFLDACREGDEFFLLTFNSRPKVT